jgi:hypothetical protein
LKQKPKTGAASPGGSQLFIRAHNETLSVAAMRVGNKDHSLARIHR